MGKQTPLYSQHLAAGAKIVDFAGWDMPLHYGSQLEEHRRVREDCGMFDVSHMQVLDLVGPAAESALRRLLANDVARLQEPGRALYSCMLNEQGGILDDLIVYKLGAERFRVVVNAATAAKDRAWIEQQTAGEHLTVSSREQVLIAVQGPRAREQVLRLFDGAAKARVDALARFTAAELDRAFVARTGYTGEDGFELVLEPDYGVELWQRLIELGVPPCGLGARDTLRLEAGLNLYGQDMDESTTPLESNLAWTVAWNPQERDFIGRGALEAQQQAGVPRQLTGVVLETKGVLRPHLPVFCAGAPCGELTSGSFSPVMGQALGLARVTSDAQAPLEVEIRGKRLPVKAVSPPFVRAGRVVV